MTSSWMENVCGLQEISMTAEIKQQQKVGEGFMLLALIASDTEFDTAMTRHCCGALG